MSEQIFNRDYPNEVDFPFSQSLAERLRFALKYAIQAPSSHNTQPWHFIVGDDSILLCADRMRSLAVVDPYDRELTISCGAALLNLRVALSHFGCPYEITPFPYSGDSDVLALLKVGPHGFIDPGLKPLFAAIQKRKTNRNIFTPSPVPEDLQAKMSETADAEGVALTCVAAEARRRQIAELVSEADRQQFANPQFRRELASWIHSSRLKDGLPVYSYGINALLDNATPLVSTVVRTFDIGNNIAATHAQLAEGSPLLACLSTAADNPQTWLTVGQALQRVLLVVADNGFDVSYLNQPIEVPPLRAKLHSLAGGEACPQLLLRVGRGASPPHSPRRPLEDTLW